MTAAEKNLDLSQNLEPLLQEIMAIAADNEGDGQTQLLILRQLELLHRKICADYFYQTLPERRRDLYNLLRDMEENGGWPYIARPKLKMVMQALLEAEAEDEAENKTDNTTSTDT